MVTIFQQDLPHTGRKPWKTGFLFTEANSQISNPLMSSPVFFFSILLRKSGTYVRRFRRILKHTHPHPSIHLSLLGWFGWCYCGPTEFASSIWSYSLLVLWGGILLQASTFSSGWLTWLLSVPSSSWSTPSQRAGQATHIHKQRDTSTSIHT